MKASVAIAIALASSSVAPGKYSLYRSYNTLYTSAFLSRLLYCSDFIFQRQVAIYIYLTLNIIYISIYIYISYIYLTFFSVIIMIITRPQLANTEKN